MRRARWIIKNSEGSTKPIFYHCISRVVTRKYLFGAQEKEKFRTLMRMYEKFSGCRVVSYCLMCNHIHLLIEVPMMPPAGLTDAELLRRLSALYSEAFVANVAAELSEARENHRPLCTQEIHARFAYRMHDLGQFMKGLLQRFTQWFNRTHSRTGTLWEERFKSVIVEDGTAAKTIAAYIDLNPVRAGIVQDPAEYRWSSYGEAIGGGNKGNGKTARAGLVRALRAHQGTPADATLWANNVAQEYRQLLLTGSIQRHTESIKNDGKLHAKVTRKGISKTAAASEPTDIPLGKMLRHRIRYFTDGAVIGSRNFIDETFNQARERFGPKRQTGARKFKGPAAPASAILWSLRDLTGVN